MEQIFLNGVNLHTTYGLILAKKEVGIPERQVLTLEVPGRNGILDLTTQLYGNTPKYQNRTIELTFFNPRGMINSMEWPELLTTLSEAFHGKVVTIKFSSDTSHYYSGRCSMSFEENGGSRGIVMTFDCDPYKYSVAAPTTTSL